MEFLRLQVVRAVVIVFFILFLDKVAYRVESDEIVQVANVGDNIRLTCNRPGGIDDNYKDWYRNGTFLANKNGISVNDPRMTQKYNQYGYLDSNIIYISDIRIDDSATYTCFNFYGNEVRSYDVRVIGCTCSLAYHTESDKEKVICYLENYWTTVSLPLTITINRNMMESTHIQYNAFTFVIYRLELYNDLKIEFNPYSNAYSNITCTLPAQTTPTHPSTRYPTTPFYTPSIAITRNEEFVSSRTASQELTSGTQYPTTQHPTPQDKISGQDNSTGNGNITMIIAILGSVFILILIVIIIVLGCKKTKDRQKNKFNGNVSIKKEYAEACYESVQDESRKNPEYATSIEKARNTSRDQESVDDPGNGGLVDNILYDSSDRITENSISRVEGPLDNALYAMPDKRATINRESKSEIVDGSSSSDVLYGNSDIISQHEQSKDTLQRGDQYENVEMPGLGSDAEEIQLYAMPDKGPKRNTLKTTPKPEKTSTLSKNEVVDADALYAEVDKPKKK